jgi:hypothetical protein
MKLPKQDDGSESFVSQKFVTCSRWNSSGWFHKNSAIVYDSHARNDKVLKL